jgi:hypothetical protein
MAAIPILGISPNAAYIYISDTLVIVLSMGGNLLKLWNFFSIQFNKSFAKLFLCQICVRAILQQYAVLTVHTFRNDNEFPPIS